MVGLSTLWRNAASYAEGLRWAAALMRRDLAPRDRLWLHIVEADLGLGSGDPRLMADAACRRASRSRPTVDDEPAAGHRHRSTGRCRRDQPARARRGGPVGRRRPGPRGRRARTGTGSRGRSGSWRCWSRAAGTGLGAEIGELGAPVGRRVRPVHLRLGGLGGRARRPRRACAAPVDGRAAREHSRQRTAGELADAVLRRADDDRRGCRLPAAAEPGPAAGRGRGPPGRHRLRARTGVRGRVPRRAGAAPPN